jgi:hypothetical protein
MYAHSIGRSETIGSDYCYNMGYERPLQFLGSLRTDDEKRAQEKFVALRRRANRKVGK